MQDANIYIYTHSHQLTRLTELHVILFHLSETSSRVLLAHNFLVERVGKESHPALRLACFLFQQGCACCAVFDSSKYAAVKQES